MPKPRYSLILPSDTPYYHCVSRCVRRAFLCGKDGLTGQSYDHRRGWIEDKILALSSIFALDVCAYAVMSNHYHIVLHINKTSADNWDMADVIHQWHQLFNGALHSQRFARGESLNKSELLMLKRTVKIWRQRLLDISWFMRVLNESIAREANKEDHCTGRFWEGRFKSQALLDESALLACMAYIDLNPIRAGIAKTPETSDYTSIKRRIEATHQSRTKLYPFAGNPRKDMPEGLPFRLTDYISLVDWTGRIVRKDKRGAIDDRLPPILERLHQDKQSWLYVTSHFESRFKHFVGAAHIIRKACSSMGYQRCSGINACSHYFT